MPKSKASLNELLYDIRRIEEHREVLTEAKIKKIYKSLMKDLDAFLGDGYRKYADTDGRFFLSYLDAQNKRASFLNEIVENVDGITPKLKRQIENLIDETYEQTYSGMVEALKQADTAEKLKYITADISVQEDVLKETVNNNVNKLTLPSVLEKHRAEIVYSIQQELAVGLMNGDRYDQMAKRIAEKVNISQTKAMNIARTESHRNIESGFMDCAENIQDGLDGSEYIYAATWRTMKDGNVRPYSRRRTKGGWKTYKSSNGADHTIMEGVTVKAGEMFDLQDGNETKAPGKSGIAKHDCNCRCFLEYNLMTEKEFAEATNQSVEQVREKYSNKTLDNSADSGIIDAEDIIIGRSVGAKAKNYDVIDPETGEFFNFVEGTKIQNVEVFAGKGTKTIFRKADKFAARYGGNAEDWQHAKGLGVLDTADGNQMAEVHWVQCANIGKFEFFVKKWLD